MPGPFNYDELFSEASADTPIRTVTHAEYDFAVAYPAPETLPVDGLTTSLQVMLDARADEMARNLAYYPQALGSPELREYTSHKLMEDRGISVSPDEIMLTAGSSEAIGLLIQALTDPGDTVLTERYVYAGTLGQLQRFGADVVGVPIDDDGIIPDALSELIDDLTAAGQTTQVSVHHRRTPEPRPARHFRNRAGETYWKSHTATACPSWRTSATSISGSRGRPSQRSGCWTTAESLSTWLLTRNSSLPASGSVTSRHRRDVMRRAANFRVGGGPSQLSAYAVEGFLRDNLDQHRARFNPLLKEKRDAMTRLPLKLTSQAPAPRGHTH